MSTMYDLLTEEAELDPPPLSSSAQADEETTSAAGSNNEMEDDASDATDHFNRSSFGQPFLERRSALLADGTNRHFYVPRALTSAMPISFLFPEGPVPAWPDLLPRNIAVVRQYEQEGVIFYSVSFACSVATLACPTFVTVHSRRFRIPSYANIWTT
jgi:hypothetical protein